MFTALKEVPVKQMRLYYKSLANKEEKTGKKNSSVAKLLITRAPNRHLLASAPERLCLSGHGCCPVTHPLPPPQAHLCLPEQQREQHGMRNPEPESACGKGRERSGACSSDRRHSFGKTTIRSSALIQN